MYITNGLDTKTTIEHIIFLNQKSIVQVCKDLNVTPQQFSDWIKKRRPIPEERLDTLIQYFNIEEFYLVDENNYARNMSALTKIELEILVISNFMEGSQSQEDVEEYKYTVNKLKIEQKQQIRIARLAAILERGDDKVINTIDKVLDKLEQGDLKFMKTSN